MESSPRLGLGIINITPFVEGLIYYQSTCLEFRYGNRKVLGTQPHLTRGSASTHCVPCLNLIKDTLNIVILTSMHLKQANMTYSSIMALKIYFQVQKHHKVNSNKRAKSISLLRKWQTSKHIHVHHPKQDHIQINACSKECMAYLIAPQHLCINTCTYSYVYVHGK